MRLHDGTTDSLQSALLLHLMFYHSYTQWSAFLKITKTKCATKNFLNVLSIASAAAEYSKNVTKA